MQVSSPINCGGESLSRWACEHGQIRIVLAHWPPICTLISAFTNLSSADCDVEDESQTSVQMAVSKTAGDMYTCRKKSKLLKHLQAFQHPDESPLLNSACKQVALNRVRMNNTFVVTAFYNIRGGWCYDTTYPLSLPCRNIPAPFLHPDTSSSIIRSRTRGSCISVTTTMAR